MRQKSVSTAGTPEKLVRDIRRATRKQYSAEEKIPHCAGRTARRGEHLGAVPPGRHCRLDVSRLVEGVPGGRQAPAGGRHRPRRDVGEVKDLRREAAALKEVVADLTLENRLLKKSMSGDGEDEA
jgi:transposase